MNDDIKGATLVLGALLYRDMLRADAHPGATRAALAQTAIDDAAAFMREAQRQDMLPA